MVPILWCPKRGCCPTTRCTGKSAVWISIFGSKTQDTHTQTEREREKERASGTLRVACFFGAVHVSAAVCCEKA